MAIEKLKPLDRILETFFSLAAVPVLLGALFKLTHSAPFGSPNTWLKVGLYTEALVFLSYGLRYLFSPPKKVDELGNSSDNNDPVPVVITNMPNQSLYTPTEAGNAVVGTSTPQAGAIAPNALNELTEKFKSLEVALENIRHSSANITGTEAYTLKVKEATASLNELNKFYDRLRVTSQAMSDSAEDAQKTQKEMAILAQNLSKLNQIYGGMISAMQMKGI